MLYFSGMKQRTEVVAALVVRGGKFLICRRAEGRARAHLWEFVGGKREAGETEAEALDRECREELGVGARTGELYCAVSYDYPDISIRLSLFRAELTGEPRALEHEALAWIAPSEISSYAFCPADTEILEKIGREGI